jgi:hypothetical protein
MKPTRQQFLRIVIRPFVLRLVILAAVMTVIAFGESLMGQPPTDVKFGVFLCASYLCLWFGDRSRRFLWAHGSIGLGKLVSLGSILLFVLFCGVWWVFRN